MEESTYYKILEVAESASQEEIRSAFRRLAREYHPDTIPEEMRSRRIGRDAIETFKDLQEAYSVLSDTDKRRRYDELLRSARQDSAYTPPPPPPPPPPSPPRASSAAPQAPATAPSSSKGCLFALVAVILVVVLFNVLGRKNQRIPRPAPVPAPAAHNEPVPQSTPAPIIDGHYEQAGIFQEPTNRIPPLGYAFDIVSVDVSGDTFAVNVRIRNLEDGQTRLLIGKGGADTDGKIPFQLPYLLNEANRKYNARNPPITGEVEKYYFDDGPFAWGGTRSVKIMLPPHVETSGRMAFPRVADGSRSISLVIPALNGWAGGTIYRNIQLARRSNIQEVRENSGAEPQSEFVGVVTETMNSGGYTYVNVDNGQRKVWAACPQFEVSVGERVKVPEGMPMQNYESKSMSRVFDLIYFVSSIRRLEEGPDSEVTPIATNASIGWNAPPNGAVDVSGDYEGVLVQGGGQRNFSYRWTLRHDTSSNSLAGRYTAQDKSSTTHLEEHVVKGEVRGLTIYVTDEEKRFLWGTLEGNAISGFASWDGFDKGYWGTWKIVRTP